MPRGDGTSPRGQGAGTGKGRGRREQVGNRFGAGPRGSCVCLNCGTKVAHQPRVPCNTTRCPKCGAIMVRE